MEIEVKKQEPLHLSEVEKELRKINKKDRIPVQERGYDFIRKFEKLGTKKANKLTKEIKGLEVPRVTDFHIYQIANIMPKTLGELRTVFAGTKTTVTPENLQKILKVVKKYEK